MSNTPISFSTAFAISKNGQLTNVIFSSKARKLTKVDVRNCPNTTRLGNIKNISDNRRKEWLEIIENYQKPSKNCGKSYVYNLDKHIIKPNNCNQYSCSRCRPRKIWNLIQDVEKIAIAYGLTRFLTITVGGNENRSYLSIKRSFEFLNRKFDSLKILYKREFGVNLRYICFIRAHKNGICHLHILINRFIPKSWLNNATKRLGLGQYASNIKFVDIHRVGAYLGSYLMSKKHEWFIPKNKKHYTTSQDIRLEGFIPEDTWIFIQVAPNIPVNNKLECVYSNILFYTGKPPPFEFLLGCFYDSLHNKKNTYEEYIMNSIKRVSLKKFDNRGC